MKMNRAILRLAVAIHQQIHARPDLTKRYDLPNSTWQEYERRVRYLHRAQQQGWNFAIQHCQQHLQILLDRLQCEITCIAKRVVYDQNPPVVASIRDIYDDVRALQDEFDAVAWNLRQQTLSVTIAPIELEEVYLGPFRIELDWSGLNGDHYNYSVIALDPQPAADDKNVTHPHVLDQVLCEGDGKAAIRCALQQGRLADFFTLVQNILQTYNSAGPYVSLDHWLGDVCADCGEGTHDDEAVSCEACNSTVCGNCYYSCTRCDRLLCSECAARCPVCDRVFCSRCLTRCSDCRLPVCRGCRTAERCQVCHAKETDKGAEPPQLDGTHEARSAIQPSGLGEVAIPA